MTEDASYTARLERLSQRSWKTRLDVQAPYRWNLRRLQPGRVLDVGCGIGRNLAQFGGKGVGVDHNPTSVAAARAAGLTAYVPEELAASPDAQDPFDTMLVAHVLEHLPEDDAQGLLTTYLPYVRPGGQVVLITPQPRGYASDATHVRYVDAARSERHLTDLGLTVERSYSFPFPRLAGRVFVYNEWVVTGRLPR